MKQIPTAEDILESIQLENGAMFSSYISPHGNIAEIVNKAMIEFAKLHVEAALEAASKGQIERDLYMMREYGESMDWKSSILKSYPLENIK